ncbi:MAG: DNA-binding protein WhiA [Clostridiales bacterium]|nr:DNA-binding protein WhiA [Clostridiales bacterium]
MSFSAEVKNEICKTSIIRPCCTLSEVYGLILYATAFNCREIRITTSNSSLKKRIPILFQKGFGILIPTFGVGSMTTFLLTEQDEIKTVFSAFGYDFRDTALHLNRGIIDDDCCKSAFLRGAFLSGGSITNPEKKYHLELATNHLTLNREVISLLLDLDVKPKTLKRKNSYIIYLKDSGHIEDFLTMIGAPISAMHLMQAKVEKDLRNKVNRQVNCETANLSKTIEASIQQLNAIRLIDQTIRIDSLDKTLYDTAVLRIQNPEASLGELARLSSTPVSKPGLSHRLNKLIELSKKIVDNNL